MFPYLHFVVRIQETSVPPLHDSFMISSIVQLWTWYVVSCLSMMWVTAILQ